MKNRKKCKFCFVTVVSKKSWENTRCWGFYANIRYARELIKNHSKLLSENGCYDYAVIEKFETGYLPFSGFQEWYKIGNKKAIQISRPQRFKNVVNFAIG